MTDPISHFGKRYRRFLLLFGLLSPFIPLIFRSIIQKTIGRLMSPFNNQSEKFKSTLLTSLPGCDSEALWGEWRDSHTAFVMDFMNYRHLDKRWLEKHVTVENPVLLQQLKVNGGLLLTYHTHHQNTLCCALGLAGCKVSAVAAAPENSPLFPLIGKWARLVNSTSAQHFRGGDYFFTNDLRSLSRSVREALCDSNTLVCLADFSQSGSNAIEAILLGKRISPPTGIIEIALKLQTPIYVALFAPVQGKLTLRIAQLAPNIGLKQLIEEYFLFLENSIALNPSCWQGWEWYADLPH